MSAAPPSPRRPTDTSRAALPVKDDRAAVFPYTPHPDRQEDLALYALQGILEHAPTSTAVTQGVKALQGLITRPDTRAHLLLCGAEHLVVYQKRTWHKAIAFLQICDEAGWSGGQAFLQKGQHGDLLRRYQGVWYALYDYETSSFTGTNTLWKQPKALPLLGKYLGLLVKLLPPPEGLKACVLSAVKGFNFPLLDALRLGCPKAFPTLTSEELKEGLCYGLMADTEEILKASVTISTPHALGLRMYEQAILLCPTLPVSFFESVRSSLEREPEGWSWQEDDESKEALFHIVTCAHRAHERALLTTTLPASVPSCSTRPRM